MIHNSVNEAKSSACGGGPKSQSDKNIEENLSKIKNKIFVMSGKGGVGKSSIAANIAAGLADKGFKVGLMDVDLHGPSIATITGISGLLDINMNKQLIPAQCGENLGVISMQSLMKDTDQAVIWRGPAKAGMIHQFIGSVHWGNLDYLIIDAPPGTGDEPLTVIQAIKDAKALIVTTPQKVALNDVRKSISFCKTVKIDVLGLVENMGPFKCPGCEHEIELFKSGGGQKTAEDMGINFIGTLPFDPEVVTASDEGTPIIRKNKNSHFSKGLEDIIASTIRLS
ncbi:MAG: Mrp/NBP35 family ATP-binding protein [Desulfobacterales bacterium]|nr:Mrp/NBP35 family ATP-binding protein [Desulfobacterales bacterium]